MRITTKGRYALRAVHTLAKSNKDKPVSIRELAEKEDISPEFLEQIFFRLKKTGMISSTRGPGGGFRLNRPPEEITLYDILEAAGEGVEFTPCLAANQDGPPCERIETCVAHEVWKEASDKIKEYFNKITLKGIMDKYQKQ
jgi:Rrf2 family transcriptional regulator, iron-sulfur cluster assembly transcription factor